MEGLAPYIYGIHDAGGESLLAGRGQVLISESIGAQAGSVRGADYSPLARQGLGVIVRLNYSHHGQGTLPHPDHYADFAATCARFVAQSRGCAIWIVGNEPNHPVERPQGIPITPQQYGACFRLCRAAIRQVGSHHRVLPAAVGPWNAETAYLGNETGDWVQYFADMLHAVGECDGLTLHAYTRGSDPATVASEQRMQPPFARRRYGFRVYQDFLAAVPTSMRRLPVLLTEMNQYDAWVDADTGVVQAMYREIDAWNQQGGQPIVAGILYRWLPHDRWSFRYKTGVHADLRAAIAQGYRAPQARAQPAQEPRSDLHLPLVARSVDGVVEPEPAPRRWDARLDRLGVTLDEYPARPGERYWRLVSATWLDEQEAQGRINIFVDVRDAQGQRVAGVPVAMRNGGEAIITSEHKEHDPYAVDYALDFVMAAAGHAYAVQVEGLPSDCVRGMGLGDLERRDHRIHVAYKLTFQLTTMPADSQPVPSPEPSAPDPSATWLLTALARVLGIERRLAQAFLQVESGGHSFVDGRLVIRFEAHLLRGYLHNDAWYARHFRHHPSEPWKDHSWRRDPDGDWRPVHVGGTFAQRQAAEWEVFEFAAGFNRDAALRSLGMGSAQVMGFNHAKVGYDTPEAMFRDYGESALNQIVGLFAYCHNTPGLVQAMQGKDWRRMALLYNGEGQADLYAHALQRVYNELGG